MKYLIGENCVVTMRGKAVTTSKLSEDYVYDTSDDDGLSVATMKEIAEANEFELKKKKSADVKDEFDEALSNLDLPEKREMSQSEKVNEIVKIGSEEGKTEDEILIQIVQSGVKFQAAAKMMKQAQIDLGLSISSKDRYTKSKVHMEDEDFEPETYSEVAEMAKALAEKVPNTSEKQAIAQIRKFCKEIEVEMPKKPKATGAPFGIRILAWIASNPEAKPTVFEDWLEENERTEKFITGWSKKFVAMQAEVKKVEAEKAAKSPKKKGKKK